MLEQGLLLIAEKVIPKTFVQGRIASSSRILMQQNILAAAITKKKKKKKKMSWLME